MIKTTTANIGLAIWRLTYFDDTFVLNPTVMLRMNFSAKNPALHQAGKRNL